MLPAFPKARQKMLDLWNQALFCSVNGSDPFLAQIPVRAQKEGNAASTGGSPVEYKARSVSYTFKTRDAEGMTMNEFLEAPLKLGAEIAAQQVGDVFDELKNPSPYSVPIYGVAEWTLDLLLETWDQMHVDFDADGMPLWPRIVLSPVASEELRTKLPNWVEDPNNKQKWENLIEKKRKEFHEREACRRLVD